MPGICAPNIGSKRVRGDEFTQKAQRFGAECHLTVHNGRVENCLKDELFLKLHQGITDLEKKVQGIEVWSVKPAPSTEIETESKSVASDLIPFSRSGAYNL